MKGFTHYQVGAIYDEFKTKIPAPQIDIRDGKILLKILYDNIIPQEKILFANSSFSVEYKTEGIISLFRFVFSGVPMETPYNPFLLDPGFLDKYNPGQGIPLIIMLAEATTGELINIRVCGLSNSFSQELKEKIYDFISQKRVQYSLDLFNTNLDLYFATHPLSTKGWTKDKPDQIYLRTIIG